MSDTPASDTFFDHFARMKTTKFGEFLVRRLAKRAFKHSGIKKRDSLLEIGPGRGIFAAVCLDNGIDYWSVEANQKMAQDLQRRGANVVTSMVPPIPKFDRTFDVVVMINLLEHMDTMLKALQLVKEAYELLNPGGRIVIMVPDYMNWGKSFFLDDFTHNYVTTWPRLEGLLISASFENVKCSYHNTYFEGLMCVLTSIRVFWLPFAYLHAIFPRNRVFYKLYKLQINLARRVLVIGQRPLKQLSG
jgi:SAM-dependent methyltransferase